MKKTIIFILLTLASQLYLCAQEYSIDASSLHKELMSGHLKMGNPGPPGKEILINNQYMTIGGNPVIPVMGEFHYSRFPEEQWEDILLKMKANGINIIATYVFWIHHEEIEGQFDWSGNKDLRRFIKLCQDNDLLVYPRIGPWCHGEVRNGGTPDWLLKMKYIVDRSDNPVYQYYVDRYFNEIGIQMKGLYYKDGGPIIGIQLENEYRVGPSGNNHILWLKETARKHGIDVPMYTVTGWGNAAVPQDEVIPLFGGYPAEPWATHINKIENNPVFTFEAPVNDERIGNENAKKENNRTVDYTRYPYFACELGVGNQVSGHRRPVISRLDGLAIATIKTGSGCNLPGYYVFAGGVNPTGILTTMEENQNETGYWNDYPDISYDFQAAIKETGELAPSYYQVKKLHYFLNEFGEELAPMLPALGKNPDPYTGLEYAVREKDNRGFLFGSNYYRYHPKPLIKGVRFNIKLDKETIVFPSKGIDIPDSCIFIWPLNMDINGSLLKYATAQPLFKFEKDRGTDWFFIQNKGIIPEICLDTSGVKLLKATSGRISKKDGMYLIKDFGPGIKNNISFIGRTGKVQRLIILSVEEADKVWKFTSGGKKYLFISDANLYMKDDQLFIFGYNPEVKVLSIGTKIEPGIKPQLVGEYDEFTFRQPAKKIELGIRKRNLFEDAEWLKASVDDITVQNSLFNKIFFKEFSLGNPSPIKSATLYMRQELPAGVRINDIWLNQVPQKGKTNRIDITGYLKHGANNIMVRFPFVKGDSGFIAKIKVEYFNSDIQYVGTNTSWQTMTSYTLPAPWTDMNNLKAPVVMDNKSKGDDNSDYNGWAVSLPPNCTNGLKNLFLHVNYTGDKGQCRLGGKLISDSYNIGLPWPLQIKSLGTQVDNRELMFEFFPLEKNYRIFFDIPPGPSEIGTAKVDNILVVPEYSFNCKVSSGK